MTKDAVPSVVTLLRCIRLAIFLVFPSIAMAQTVSPWPEANRLFHSDPLWLGGDAAFSVDLGNGRVLWMFGDSFIAQKAGNNGRAQTAFIRNSAAIETGYDPSTATLRFYEGHRDGHVADFMPPGAPGTWRWPMHGIRLGNKLLLFYMDLTPDLAKNSLGFRVAGWEPFMVENPDADPSQWSIQPLAGFETHGQILVGMSVIREGDALYAFVLQNQTHDAYLLRWPLRDAAEGNLLHPQWWCGPVAGWCADAKSREIVIHDAGPEFSVQEAPHGNGFVAINNAGFGATTIVLRHAQNIEGPWSQPQFLYRPPESDVPGALVYAGKSHPELAGGDLVVTYVANGPEARLAKDMSIYFPQFVRVSLPSGQ